MSKCLRCGAGSEWIQGKAPKPQPHAGRVLKEARLANGFGMRQFAQHLGMLPSRISEIETTGDATPEEWQEIVESLMRRRYERQREAQGRFER